MRVEGSPLSLPRRLRVRLLVLGLGKRQREHHVTLVFAALVLALGANDG